MYKFDKNHQFALADFNQPMGLKMNPENRWVKKTETKSLNSDFVYSNFEFNFYEIQIMRINAKIYAKQIL